MVKTQAAAPDRPVIGIWHLIAGIIMAVLGIYVWFNPVVSLVALALYLGIAFIVVGAGYLAVSFSFQSAGTCWSDCWIFSSVSFLSAIWE